LAEVQLVDARDRFVHNVAAIRSVVDPSLLDRIVIPYDRLLRRGSVRQSVVAGVSNSGVTLTGEERIEGDIIVVATGSHYASPFKPQGESTQAFVDGVVRPTARSKARTLLLSSAVAPWAPN
jgi:NADH dehydrogenase FAD-containing subunit